MEILFVLCFIIILMSKDALDITLSFTLKSYVLFITALIQSSIQCKSEHAEAEYYPSKIQSFRSKYIISNFHFESYLDFQNRHAQLFEMQASSLVEE